jgi:peptide/nickel transport system ATP-binding protein
MYDGQAVETNNTAQIFAAPSHPYTRALLWAVPRLGSMEGRPRPMRFPIFDRVAATSDEPTETQDTVVANERPVLEVANLTTRFPIRSGLFGKVSGRVHAVENISFSLQAGETLALVGESGCGKSTTGRSILKLIEPDSGAVLVDGQDVLGMDARALRAFRRHMQIVFQDPFASLNPRMSVGSAIAAPLCANGLVSSSQAREMVADLLVRVGLTPDMASRFPHEFSGGQRQRICIARALALEPKLIIADEAVSALDVSVKAQVVNLMLDLQASMGLAYLFISHDIAVVERISHRVAGTDLGEIVEIGPRAAVFGKPQHPIRKSSWPQCRSLIPRVAPGGAAAYRTMRSGVPCVPLIIGHQSASIARLRRAMSSRFGARNGRLEQRDSSIANAGECVGLVLWRERHKPTAGAVSATRLVGQHRLEGGPFKISEFIAHDSPPFGSLNHRRPANTMGLAVC